MTKQASSMNNDLGGRLTFSQSVDHPRPVYQLCPNAECGCKHQQGRRDGKPSNYSIEGTPRKLCVLFCIRKGNDILFIIYKLNSIY